MRRLLFYRLLTLSAPALAQDVAKFVFKKGVLIPLRWRDFMAAS